MARTVVAGLIVAMVVLGAMAFFLSRGSALPTPDRTKAAMPLGEEWKAATATVFWVGEAAGRENGFIANDASAWDEKWTQHFGGTDDPECRSGFYPCAFVPKENPFYIALPYNDLDDTGARKADAPDFFPSTADGSALKNRWVEVASGGTSCFGQWEDVGPFGEDDYAYVFGGATEPRNKTDERAGIDLSPAMRDCLHVGGVSEVRWRLVETSDVPPGPWRDIITAR